jgi:ubiquinone/menaquinone biosynthesis C-methylase UbiE
MCKCSNAPTGQTVIAQGIALGTSVRYEPLSPNGANWQTIKHVAPLGQESCAPSYSQGVALGYLRLCRWHRVPNCISKFAIATLMMVAFASLAFGQDKADPKGVTKYLGRRVASPMGYMHMNWLNRPERIKEENPQEMLEQLKLHDGMVVCDLGAGDGYHTLQMAPRVGPNGKIIAVDIQPEMLQALSRKLAELKYDNVETTLGELWDPKLPDASIDLVLMVDVYHEFSHPVQMLAALRKALKPDGLIALVEFRAEDPTVLIRPEHKMSKVQIRKEYTANGFKLANEYEQLPWQHLMFMQVDDTWTTKDSK